MRTFKKRDGTEAIDERPALEEWLAEFAAGTQLDSVHKKGDAVFAVLSDPASGRKHISVFPPEVTLTLAQYSRYGGKPEKKTYTANRETHGRKVFVTRSYGEHEETAELDPTPSQKATNHSPDGFEWGYGGSGPSQLALAILIDLFLEGEPDEGSRALPLALYQDFKWRFIANLPAEKWALSEDDIRKWAKDAAGGRLL